MKVYHNNDKCTERNNIEKSNIGQGKGGLLICSKCKKLNHKSDKL
jgi:hypothetical protein